MSGSAIRLIAIAVLMVLLPLAGALLSVQPLGSLLRFPLNARAWDPTPVSLVYTYGAYLIAIAVLGALMWLSWPRRQPQLLERTSKAKRSWPGYIWLAALLLILVLIALDAAALNAAIGLLTLALTLLVNADTERRTGSSLIRQRRGYFLALFPLSLAAGWLAFYWLNLYLGLWVYPGAAEAAPFALGKSLDYATLLPALLSLRQWLGSFPSLLGWTSKGLSLAGQRERRPEAAEGWTLLSIGSIALAAGAAWPETLYPIMLVAPTLLAIGLQMASRQPTSLVGVAHGDWSRPLLTSFAALLLLAFSQSWNLLLGGLFPESAWAYQLPLLGGPKLLELPAPAWLIVIPLALLGLWLADQLTEPFRRRPQRPPFRPGSPVHIPVIDLLRDRNRR